MGPRLFKKAGVDEVNTIIEYILCYAGAFGLGLITGLMMTLYIRGKLNARSNTK
jgi:hypothetical protein